MDFSNYGKIKKIFYIVAIISMLLSIKSRVLGVTDVSINDFPSIPEVYDNQNFIIAKNSAGTNYYLFVLNSTINNNHIFYNNNINQLTFASGSGKLYYTSVNNGSSWIYFSELNSSNQIDRYGVTISEILLSSVDIYDPTDTNIVFQKNYPTILAPHFDNVTEIENGNPDGVFISPVDYSENDYLYFHLLEIDTTVSTSDGTIYYYSDKTFALNKDSDYYRTWYDPSIEGFYYYIPRYKLGLSQNTSYLYVLNNSKKQIQNSHGIYEKDIDNGIFDVLQSDTAGVISASEEESDRMKNIEDTLNNDTPDSNIDNDIADSFNYNKNTGNLSSTHSGFISRLMALFSSMQDYNLNEDSVINIPVPHSNKYIILHSNIISSHIVDPLKSLISAFWMYIFYFYMYKFLNYIFIEIEEGKILDENSLNNAPGALYASVF